MELSFGPLSVLFLVLASALAVGCVILSGRRARRIEQMSVPSLRELVRELRKHPVDERPAELLRKASDGTWENRLGREVLADQSFARGERVDEGAVVEVAEHALEVLLFVQRLGQAALQLVGGEWLDQVVVRRQFGDRDHVVIAALGGDDHEHGG